MTLPNTRFAHLLIICAMSLAVAGACYMLGGYVAEVSSNPTKWAPAFKASGSLAGFLIVFFSLTWMYGRFRGATLDMQVTLVLSPPLKRKQAGYSVVYSVRKFASGILDSRPGEITWQSGGPCVLLRNVEESDLVAIKVSSENGDVWETDYFNPLNPSITLKELSE